MNGNCNKLKLAPKIHKTQFFSYGFFLDLIIKQIYGVGIKKVILDSYFMANCDEKCLASTRYT